MKRRTNPAPRRESPVCPEFPQELVNSVELWAYTFTDSRKSSLELRAMIEEQFAADGVKIVPTSKVHKGCRVHQVFRQNVFLFSLSVSSIGAGKKSA